MVVFKSEHTCDIPNKDVLSWTFDNVPVSEDQHLWVDGADASQYYTVKEAKRVARVLAHGFRQEGVLEGETICICARNQILYPVLFFGILAAGAVFTGTNPAYTVEETVHQFTLAKCKLVVVDPDLEELVREAAAKCKHPIRIFVIGSTLNRLLQGKKELDWPRFTTEKECADTVALIMFSSGTTGLPKGVMITHRNLVANTEQRLYFKRKYEAEKKAQGVELAETVWLGHLPMFHAFGVMAFINMPPITGTKTVIMRKFELQDFCRLIQTYRVTELSTVPPVILGLAKHPIVSKFDLSSLRNVLCGAAPLGREVQKQFIQRMRSNRGRDIEFNMTQGWGMTEVTCALLGWPYGVHDETGGVGQLNPNCLAKLVDENGEELGVEEEGELLVQGPIVMKGYLDNPEATRDAFDGPWLKTGDVAKVTKDGVFFIVDRKKELIKHRGLQIAPAALEALLLEHPQISDVAVVGLQLEGDEYPRAYVVRTDEKLKEKDVADWIAGRVAKFKQLSGGVKFIDEIPKNPSGKILRRFLRDRAKVEVKELPRARL